MLVPRIPLVDQQKHRFHKYVRGKNMLKSVRQDERVYVCDFSLLIFDEVHHCVKEHPYNILMQTVHDYQGPKPQTMGLTASLGVGMATSDESGMASIYELMANIGATSLASVKRHLDILEQYVPKPVDTTKKVDRPPMEKSPFLRAVINIMEKIQRDIEPQLKKLTQDNQTSYKLSKEEVKFEDPLATEKYIQKVNTLTTTLGRIRSGDFKFEPSIALEYLGVLSQGISINDLMPARYALEYLTRNLRELSKKFEVECSQRFYQYFAQNEGTSKKSTEYGQTKEEQQRALDDFSRGKKKVLIATAVVEEGLDVSTCNLIIKYNSSSNAVQRVQRRGTTYVFSFRIVYPP
ncbi:helicase protein [Necator americanus]|uniref:Helicase protein n=1 Tax=Necator americanus TaxID=51031 RepID=W2TWJ6_NECAM|nr:helicase protein [Necator americanus]ETN85382.1 helicase protein [Necator americanus]